jgi:putative peptidoglycan lipid II flippase
LESPRLLRSTVLVGLLTAVSRVLGYVRDVLVAALAGAGAGTDAFFVAFRVPNLLRRLLAEGAFAQALVPVLAEYRAGRGKAAVRDLLASAAGSLGVAVAGATLAGVVAAPVLVLAFAPGFLQDPERLALATDLLRVTFPYLLFVTLAALASAALQAHDRFAAPALTPVLLNLAMIGAALVVAPRLEQPVVALAWGVFAGGLAQALFQVPFLARAGLLVRPRVDFRHAGVRRVLGRMPPALFGVSVAQINLFLDTLLASFLATGSVSWLYYSDRLVEFPLGVLAIAIGTVVLPTLSRRFAQGAGEGFSATLDWGLRGVLLLGVPATLGLALLAAPLLAMLFQHGQFRASDVYMAELSLVAYALGLPGFMLVKVLAPACYARQDVRTPVRVAVVALLANLVMSLALVRPLAHAGLALATSLAALLNAGLLLGRLLRDGVYAPLPGWGRFAARLLAANLAMGLVLALGPPGTAAWTRMPASARALELALWVGAGALTYLAALALLGYRWRDLAPAVRA